MLSPFLSFRSVKSKVAQICLGKNRLIGRGFGWDGIAWNGMGLQGGQLAVCAFDWQQPHLSKPGAESHSRRQESYHAPSCLPLDWTGNEAQVLFSQAATTWPRNPLAVTPKRGIKVNRIRCRCQWRWHPFTIGKMFYINFWLMCRWAESASHLPWLSNNYDKFISSHFRSFVWLPFASIFPFDFTKNSCKRRQPRKKTQTRIRPHQLPERCKMPAAFDVTDACPCRSWGVLLHHMVVLRIILLDLATNGLKDAFKKLLKSKLWIWKGGFETNSLS